jgi:hypothetical protein
MPASRVNRRRGRDEVVVAERLVVPVDWMLISVMSFMG